MKRQVHVIAFALIVGLVALGAAADHAIAQCGTCGGGYGYGGYASYGGGYGGCGHANGWSHYGTGHYGSGHYCVVHGCGGWYGHGAVHYGPATHYAPPIHGHSAPYPAHPFGPIDGPHPGGEVPYHGDPSIPPGGVIPGPGIPLGPDGSPSDSSGPPIPGGGSPIPGKEVPPPPADKTPAKDPSSVTTSLYISVPDNATLYLLGQRSDATGGVRGFVTTGIAAGQNVDGYTVRVELNRDGRVVTQERTITLVAGKRHDLAFDFATTSVARESR